MRLYPIFMDLRGRDCVVVGGGRVATRKVRDLLEAGAQVRVIAPSVTPELAGLEASGRLTRVSRSYEDGDARDGFLVIAATGHREVNRAVWMEAERLGVPLNCVDDPRNCSFLAPSVLRRGGLTAAVSTSGLAPALAVRIRQELENLLGDHHARFLEYAGQLRHRLVRRHPDSSRRRVIWYQLVDSDVLDLLERGEELWARQRIEEIVGFSLEAPV